MKYLLISFIFLVSFAYAQKIDGSVSTGIQMGTPFWNSDNYSDGNVIDSADTFIRSVSRIQLQGRFGSHFKIVMSALRSDGFQSENRLAETKFYTFYGQYAFSGGRIKAGRFLPFMRWIRGSVDGVDFSCNITRWLNVQVLGGLHTPYGKIYDSDRAIRVAYGHLQFMKGTNRLKIKAYNDEDKTIVGFDVYGSMGKMHIGGNYGFDITNKHINDGGLSLSYPWGKKLFLAASYRLFRTLPWIFGHINYESYLIDRLAVSARYYLFDHYTLNFTQLVTLTSEHTDYLSLLILSTKFIHLGINYMSGDRDMQRLGLVLGANYTFWKDLTLSAGLAPTDYLFVNMNEHEQTVAYYLRLRYRFLKRFLINTNLNFYQNNEALHSPVRGGIQLMYYFGS